MVDGYHEAHVFGAVPKMEMVFKQGDRYLKCPTCNSWTTVEQTKSLGVFVERRRRCANDHTFSTEERVIPNKKRGRPIKTKEKADDNSQPVPV